MIRVAIVGDFMIDGVRIGIMQKGDGRDGRLFATSTGPAGHLNWEHIAENALGPDTPTLSLTNDVARALMDELVRYYHGSSDTLALRRDYDHERGRVDKMLGALLACVPPSPQPFRLTTEAGEQR